ncbi:MAG: acyltransferase family protein [Bacteroidia bacterium]
MNIRLNSPTYFENLDATRFLGFLHVFLAHCFFTTSAAVKESTAFHFVNVSIKAGFLGLDYFFVLSAFLLTWLALDERQKTKQFHAVFFMIRRAIRLWPLYFLLVFGVYSIHAFLASQFNWNALPPLRTFLLFYSNYYIIEHGQNFLFLLVFFWSIAVEEQFYLFWAFVLKFLYRYIIWICFGLIAISIVFRALYIHENEHLAFNTLSVAGNFGMGSLVAVLAYRSSNFRAVFAKRSRAFYALIYLIGLLLLLNYFSWFNQGFMLVLEKLVFSIVFVVFIMEQCFAESPLIAFGQFKRMTYLGQLSLGLYCFHGAVLTFMVPMLKTWGLAERPFQVFFLNPLIIIFLTLLISVFSYELFEKKVHNLRRFFYPKSCKK